MNRKTLDFYFDYLSPFAYFAWRRVGVLCEKNGLTLHAHPVVFGKLLDHWGQLGPAEIPPKRAWVARYCQRYASIEGFTYNPPMYHPFNPLAALRLSLKDVSGQRQFDVIDALYTAGWTQGADLGNLESLLQIIERAGINANGFRENVADPAVKMALANETAAAISRGVFGVPTIIVDEQLFWGNDQFDHIQLLLEGKDPLDHDQLQAMDSRPRGIDRKIFLQDK